MTTGFSGALAATVALLLLAAVPLWSDQPIPANILDPKSAPEAWNVIRLATENVDRLNQERRSSEIPVQISYCSPALRSLADQLGGAEAAAQVGSLVKQALASVNAIARAAKGNDPESTRAGLARLRTELDGIARHFDPRVVAAVIFSCPMHPEIISEAASNSCARCGVRLLPRRIPYSFVYAKPGEPTIRLTAKTAAPIESGKPVEVRLRMEKPDASPVLPADLIEMHTERIHLLIEEPGLGDYHHVHPTPTAVPGEYAFTFTPRKSTPHRIWADIIPVGTGVQELPFADLPSTGPAGPAASGENRFTASVDGYHFTLSFPGGKGIPLTAQVIRNLAVSVTDTAGKPVNSLEPVMNAFAHLVGFYNDFQTVVHIHPRGGDILNPALRGGPALGFDFYPPKAGFVRLYCQVRINGKMLFAPFDLNVEPYCAPLAR